MEKIFKKNEIDFYKNKISIQFNEESGYNICNKDLNKKVIVECYYDNNRFKGETVQRLMKGNNPNSKSIAISFEHSKITELLKVRVTIKEKEDLERFLEIVLF
ncbi:MAG TPA: hypothetical protein DDX39_04550 [Bacteroidales bacterium]|nr:MAG: hypothetical protein A2W98_10450 [Bacteroidetes bacterium GWF2_33_38]OFY73554.1 MAG: hypothetical protein A2265_00645 [Bacteroidetes bacterium RIFOXYA12_FULL_33_9]OFY87086.1 MAG: hypothetical protein A2236_02855 [Bacteroidetes bacterium RIFOXYA2_FULL_33_7]HBF87894.1 hypothetical protein [Bacteroidales bacterium]